MTICPAEGGLNNVGDVRETGSHNACSTQISGRRFVVPRSSGSSVGLASLSGSPDRVGLAPSVMGATSLLEDVLTYRERELSALWDAYKMARSLAHRCLRLGLQYPNYAADEKEEAARHFERAGWWLNSFRMMRASR